MTTQLDIFIPIAGEVKAKEQRDILAFPCYSLSKKKRTQEIYFEEKSTGNWIKVSPGPYGMATIWDFDILTYFATQIKECAARGEEKRHSFTVSGYDIRLEFRQNENLARDLSPLKRAVFAVSHGKHAHYADFLRVWRCAGREPTSLNSQK